MISIGDNVRIDDFCILSGKIELGSNIHISAYCLYNGSLLEYEMKDYNRSFTTLYSVFCY